MTRWLRAVPGLLLAACVATPTPTPSPPAPSVPTVRPTQAVGSITPAPIRTLGPESAYGWIVAGTSALTTWKVRHETDAAAVVTFSGDWPAVSPDGRFIAFWSPAGVRTQLRVVPAAGGPERTLLTLPSTERGETIAWSAEGSNALAFAVDATAILHGGVDPPPAYSTVRTIELPTETSREVIRRDETRLRPFGWVRARKLILVSEDSGLGRTAAYIRAGEDGTMIRDAFDQSATADCTHVSGFRMDTEATTVMTLQPQICSDGTGKLSGGSILRFWRIDQGPAQAQTFDLGPVSLVDAAFRPGTLDFVTATQSGTTVTVSAWQGRASHELTKVTLPDAGVQPRPLLFGPYSAVMLISWLEGSGSGPFTWRGRLVDVSSGQVADVDLGGELPIASVYLGP